MHGGHHFFAESENRKINWWKGFQEKSSFRKADSIIGVSQYVVNHTSIYIQLYSKIKGVIFNPVDLTKLHHSKIQKQIKGRIFFAGTVCEKKGIKQLIQAIPLIKKSFPNAHLVIAGRDWNFPKTGMSYMNYLKNFISPCILDSVHFLGPVPNNEIPTLIEEAEVCCYPSHMEAMPLAWIEVMAMGKTFVGSNTGPGSEIITHGVNALMCNPFDPVDIANKVIYLFENSDIAIEIGKVARNYAIENFSIDKIGPKNILLYNSI